MSRVMSESQLENIRAGALKRSIRSCVEKAAVNCAKRAEHNRLVKAGLAPKRPPTAFAQFVSQNYDNFRNTLQAEAGKAQGKGASKPDARDVQTGLAYSKISKLGKTSYYWNVLARAGAEWQAQGHVSAVRRVSRPRYGNLQLTHVPQITGINY